MTTLCLPKVAHLLNSRSRFKNKLPPLLYMTDDKYTKSPLGVIQKLAPGSGVVFRHYGFVSRFELGEAIRDVCKKKRLTFIVSNDYQLAVKLNSDGLHLPAHALFGRQSPARLWRQRQKNILTAASHSPAAISKCAQLSVDAALLSPVFPTQSHPNQISLGVLKFQALARKSLVPVYALGGRNDSSARHLINSSAVGLAGITGFY